MDLPQLGDELFAYLNANQRVGNRTPPVYGAKGVSSSEMSSIEDQLELTLPADFKFLFENVRDPDEVLFPWSEFSVENYRKSIDRVWLGVAFDVEHNTVWLTHWGDKPTTLEEALQIAQRDYQSWPKLLPISGHRFLPAEPSLPNNPVFSIVQTDIIYYGSNLADYLVQEFCPPPRLHSDWVLARKIPIWSDFAELTPGFN
ncbi:MAG: hypothetical protein AAGJ84_00845 [Pseudomonadota bacterium]